jgi:predicted DNA-binding protein
MDFTATIQVKLPPELKEALRVAAKKAVMSDSDFVRQAIIEKMKRE